jgi:NitT/TauT family transport system substrate-binding protein
MATAIYWRAKEGRLSMSDRRSQGWSRREFLTKVTLGGAAGFLGLKSNSIGAEPPPETTRLKIADLPRGICPAPQYVAEDLLRGEGFTELQYVRKTTQNDLLRALLRAVATGEAHMIVTFVSSLVSRLDAGDPLVFLAGSHVGCFELFGTDSVRAIRDLRGRTVAIAEEGSPEHLFLSVVLAYVGLDPRRDIRWVTYPAAEAMKLFSAGKIDAFLGFPPIPQELRARKIGHPILNSSVDRSWSQYFCCMIAANRDFVREHPVATKRAVRAIVKSVNLCALEPERTARLLVEKGYTPRYDYALQAMHEIPYGKWRDYDPEDTVRFYALSLHDIGMIKTSPNKLIAQGTDWRFIRELKKELKG